MVARELSLTSPTLVTSPRVLQVHRNDPGFLGFVRKTILTVHRTLGGGRAAPSWLRKLPTFEVTDHLGVVSRLNLTSELSELLHDAVREVSELQDDVEQAANAASSAWNGATPVQLHTDEVGAKILRTVFRGLFKPQQGWSWRTNEPEGPPRRAFTAPPNALFSAGMNDDWQLAQMRDSVLKHGGATAVSIPERLVVDTIGNDVLRTLIEPLIGARFQRQHGDCPGVAPERLAEWKRLGKFEDSPTADMTPEERRGSWMVHHLLNGMAPAHLRVVDDEPDAFELHYTSVDDLFGDEIGRAYDTYRLPEIVVRFVRAQGLVEVDTVRMRYRRVQGVPATDYQNGGDASYGPWSTVAMRDPAELDWRKERARRIVCSASLLHGQIDLHISLGHLVPEVIAVAIETARLSDDHPVRQLLTTRLAEVTIVNRGADAVIWGDAGLLTVCSALTSTALRRRFRRRVAALHWRSFRPRRTSIAPSHYAPLVHDLYWNQAVTPYVREGLDTLGGGIQSWWEHDTPTRRWTEELRRVFAQLEANWPAWAPWDGVTPASAWLDASEFAHDVHGPFTAEDVAQLCRASVYLSTLGHSWANVRQVMAGGDTTFATFGLRAQLDDLPPANPDDDTAWHARADMPACDNLYQLSVGDVLTHVDVDNFQKELHGETAEGVARDPMTGERSLAARFHVLTPLIQTRMTQGVHDKWSDVCAMQLTRTNR
jgi:hypothetical protein